MNTQLYLFGLKILVLNTSDSYVCLKSTGFPGGKSTTYIMVKNCHKLEPRTPLLWKRAEWPCMGSGSNCLGFLQEHTHCSLVQRSRVFITNSLTRLAGNQHLLQAGPVGAAQGPHGSISAAMINSEPLQLTSPLRSWRGCRARWGCRAWSCHCCGWMWNVRRARGFREKQAKYLKVTLPPQPSLGPLLLVHGPQL